MHNQLLINIHQQTGAQPVSEQWLLWNDIPPLHIHAVFIAEHDIPWHRLSLPWAPNLLPTPACLLTQPDQEHS